MWNCVTVPNFVATEISQFLDITIYKMAAVHHLGFVMRVFRPPTKIEYLVVFIACKIWLELEL